MGIRSYTYTVAPGAETDIERTGDGVHCAASNLTTFLLSVDQEPFTEFRQGYSHTPRGGFKRVRVRNDGGSNLTVTLVIWTGEFRDQRLSASAPLDIAKATGFTTNADLNIAGGAAAVILAANANRREAVITNPAASSSAFRIGDASVGAARGIELLPGATLVLETTAEIRAHNTDAAAQNISAQEVVD